MHRTNIKKFRFSFKVSQIEHLKSYKGLNTNILLKLVMADVLLIKKDGNRILVDNVAVSSTDAFKMVEDFLGVHARYNSKLDVLKDYIMLSFMSAMDRHRKDKRECNSDNCFIHKLGELYNLKKDATGNFGIKDIEKAVDNEIQLKIIVEE